MSLDRLIRLAKRTGDRLIVHNPVDETDVVIMDVDEYEALLDEKQDVRGLSERQLLNQINRDIAIWRANDKLENEYEEEIFDFEDNKTDWHSAGSVMENRGFEESDYGLEKVEEIEDDEDLEMPSLAEVLKNESPFVEATADKEENESKGLISDDEPVFYEEPI